MGKTKKIKRQLINLIIDDNASYKGSLLNCNIMLMMKKYDKHTCASEYQKMMRGGYFNDIFIYMYPFIPIEHKVTAVHG